VRALICTGEEWGVPFEVLRAVDRVNDRQKAVLFEKFLRYYNGDVRGKRVGVWGLSFKPETDDTREAPALVLVDRLLNAGCEVSVYDPVAMERAKRRLGDMVKYAKNIYQTAEDAEAIFHVTEWKEYRMPDWERIGGLMRRAVVFDGRNVFDAGSMHGVELVGIGRKM
jgi:udp-glucose 6-dehydrogenase